MTGKYSFAFRHQSPIVKKNCQGLTAFWARTGVPKTQQKRNSPMNMEFSHI